MKLIPRDYQVESVDETSKALAKGVKRPLMLLPTASGKSIIVAMIVCRVVERDPSKRVLVLCHQGHLLVQNEEKINLLNPSIRTGIYCAGQGRKERIANVILASRDSLGNNPLICGEFDLIICDEAHMIAVDALEEKSGRRSQYGKIFKAQNAKEKVVVGLTGTGWRMNRGVIWGEDKFFESVSYNVPMRRLINEGYLCAYVFPSNDVKVIDASELSVSSTGDYRTADLEAVSMPEETVNRCLDIWEREASDRKCSIFFTCSRAHGQMVADFLGERIGQDNVIYIDGNMGKSDREQVFADIKNGVYRAIINIGVLTTGFDAPIIDCVCWLRATQSVSLFVQMGGRGLRIHEGKKNCLMLDMAGNFDRFNSLEEPFGDKGKKKQVSEAELNDDGVRGEGPVKECPRCLKDDIPVGAKTCPLCGFIFINHQDIAHQKRTFEFHDILDHVVLKDQKTKSGKVCHQVYYYVPNGNGGRKELGPQYLLYKMPKWPGPQHKKVADKLDKYVPIKLQVYNNPKSKYPELSIIDWVPKGEEDTCDHQWDMSFSPSTGETIRFCEKCGEIA